VALGLALKNRSASSTYRVLGARAGFGLLAVLIYGFRRETERHAVIHDPRLGLAN
jgi:hypothetical protein